ncbi:MAG TPA: hypothetical protein VLA31_07755, partial [Burkholderiaceae bacterium]|nr:hypothetical protein [Burkholderiaceae bacterium]
VNVFDRFTYARSLRTKEPKEVREALGSILSSLPKKPKFIASDNGNEFLSHVADLLLDKGIAHRLEPVGDVNSLGVIDKDHPVPEEKARRALLHHEAHLARPAAAGGVCSEFNPQARGSPRGLPGGGKRRR